MNADVLTTAFVVVVIGGLGSFAGGFISAARRPLQSFGSDLPSVSIVLFALMAIVLSCARGLSADRRTSVRPVH
jgi:hypothetical protein